MSCVKELEKLSKEINKKMDIREIKNNLNNQETFMMVKEHGQPYNKNNQITFMVVKEHGQPYDNNKCVLC